jgi:hypothetical protein
MHLAERLYTSAAEWSASALTVADPMAANFNEFWCAGDPHNIANTGNRFPSLPTAGDCDLIWLATTAATHTAVSAPAVWVNIYGASHHINNDCTRWNWLTNHFQPIVSELGDDNKVTVRHHGPLAIVPQEYEVNPVYTAMLQLFILSINDWTQPSTLPHLDTARASYHLHQSPSRAFRSMTSILHLP